MLGERVMLGVCVYVCFCVLTQHANAFSTNPTTKCVYTQLLGERKIIITTITTITAAAAGTRRCGIFLMYVPTGSQNRPLSMPTILTRCVHCTHISLLYPSIHFYLVLFVLGSRKYLHFPWRSSRSTSTNSSGSSNKSAVNIIMQTMIFDFSINTWYRKASFAWMAARFENFNRCNRRHNERRTFYGYIRTKTVIIIIHVQFCTDKEIPHRQIFGSRLYVRPSEWMNEWMNGYISTLHKCAQCTPKTAVIDKWCCALSLTHKTKADCLSALCNAFFLSEALSSIDFPLGVFFFFSSTSAPLCFIYGFSLVCACVF